MVSSSNSFLALATLCQLQTLKASSDDPVLGTSWSSTGSSRRLFPFSEFFKAPFPMPFPFLSPSEDSFGTAANPNIKDLALGYKKKALENFQAAAAATKGNTFRVKSKKSMMMPLKKLGHWRHSIRIIACSLANTQ
uniref:Uncharacterized protein n=1 Tax=Amphimedon queenslandica TaxID=400682 RepID=A0A1X7UDS0_AMPQE